jgi:hypothetical protein
MIFIKSKKIVLDCFTVNTHAYNLHPIQSAINHYPSWWEKTPRYFLKDNFIPHSTIKGCTGLIDYYKQGFIMPLWTDISIDIKDKGYRWQCADQQTQIDIHPPQEFDQYINSSDYGHIKIGSSWTLKSKSDINWLFTKPYWNFQPIENYSIPVGVLNFKYQHSSNIQLLLSLKENSQFILKAGTPLVHLIPLTDKKVSIKTHLVSLEEYKKLDITRSFFLNDYRKRTNILKNKESKCPFGFK